MVGLFAGNGVGSKLLQAHLDGAPELYMIPPYPLMYFYPHWQDWKRKQRDDWNWDRAIDLFCEKHASVIDSRRIPGFNGMRSLGTTQDEYISVDEELFRQILSHLLKGEPVQSATFLLAVHYAYSLCLGEDISKKRVLLYHVHARQYLNYFLADFPDAKIISMTRDSRSNFGRRVKTCYNMDAMKLNKSDTYLFRALPTYYVTCHILLDTQIIAAAVEPDKLQVIRHEDLGIRLEETLKKLCAWIGLTYSPNMLKITFGGKEWWGDEIYDMPRINKFNPRVLSKDWQKGKGFIEWFVQEGLTADFFEKYGYKAEKYTNDSYFNRLLLIVFSLFPTRSELGLVGFYLNPVNVIEFISASFREAYGSLPMKDYTWNATYLYKWVYIELRLWETRPHVRLLTSMREYGRQCPLPFVGSIIFTLAALIYVSGQLLRYVYAFARLPYWFLRTRKVMFQRMREMWGGKVKLPEPLVSLR